MTRTQYGEVVNFFSKPRASGDDPATDNSWTDWIR